MSPRLVARSGRRPPAFGGSPACPRPLWTFPRPIRQRSAALSRSPITLAWRARNRAAASVRRASASAIGPLFRLSRGRIRDRPSVHLASDLVELKVGPEDEVGILLGDLEPQGGLGGLVFGQGAEDIGPVEQGPAPEFEGGEVRPDLDQAVEGERDAVEGRGGTPSAPASRTRAAAAWLAASIGRQAAGVQGDAGLGDVGGRGFADGQLGLEDPDVLGLDRQLAGEKRVGFLGARRDRDRPGAAGCGRPRRWTGCSGGPLRRGAGPGRSDSRACRPFRSGSRGTLPGSRA